MVDVEVDAGHDEGPHVRTLEGIQASRVDLDGPIPAHQLVPDKKMKLKKRKISSSSTSCRQNKLRPQSVKRAE